MQFEHIFIRGPALKVKHFIECLLTIQIVQIIKLQMFHYLNPCIYFLYFIEPFQGNLRFFLSLNFCDQFLNF